MAFIEHASLTGASLTVATNYRPDPGALTGLGEGESAATPFREDDDERVFKGFVRDGEVWHRVRMRQYSTGGSKSADAQYTDLWILTSYGHTGVSDLSFTRRPVYLHLYATRPSGSPTIYRVATLVDWGPGNIGHGQGLKLARYRFDHSAFALTAVPVDGGFVSLPDAQPPHFTRPAKPVWIVDSSPGAGEITAEDACILEPQQYTFRRTGYGTANWELFERTEFVRHATGASGTSPAFGAHFWIPDIYAGAVIPGRLGEILDDLYQEVHRPGGFFCHPDGAIPHDEETTAVLDHGQTPFEGNTLGDNTAWTNKGNAFGRPHANTLPGKNPWFKEAIGPEPAREFGSNETWGWWSPEHWAIGPIAEAAGLYEDEGLRMIVEHEAHAWLFGTPPGPQGSPDFTYPSDGTSNWTAGAARQQGRNLDFGARCYHVLANEGDTDKAERVRRRLVNRIQVQWAFWENREASQGHPFPTRGGDNTGSNPPAYNAGVAPWECNIWLLGLHACLGVPGMASESWIPANWKLADVYATLNLMINTLAERIHKWWFWRESGSYWYTPYTITAWPAGSSYNDFVAPGGADISGDLTQLDLPNPNGDFDFTFHWSLAAIHLVNQRWGTGAFSAAFESGTFPKGAGTISNSDKTAEILAQFATQDAKDFYSTEFDGYPYWIDWSLY